MSLRMLGLVGASLALAALAFGVAGAVVALAFWGPGYALSLRLHPNRNCWWCRGTGQHWGSIWTYARRPCTRCTGTGTQRRFGARS